MAQTNVSRKSPCRQCGGRYFVNSTNIAAAILAALLGLGGFVKTVLSSGGMRLMNNGTPDPAAVGEFVSAGLDISAMKWAGLGMLAAIVVAWLGSGYRCVNCDAPR